MFPGILKGFLQDPRRNFASSCQDYKIDLVDDR